MEDKDLPGIAALREKAADNAADVVRAARGGDAEEGLRLAAELKVLCATRAGPLGVSGWSAAIEALLRERLPDAPIGGRRWVGRPVIVTRNDYFNNVFNGDVGLLLARAGGTVAAFSDPSGACRELPVLAPWRDRHFLGDDDPQEPGIGVRRRGRLASARALADTHPRASLHSGDQSPATGDGGRLRRRPAPGRPPARRQGLRARAAPLAIGAGVRLGL